MRSRYSAFALGLPKYLLETWRPSTRPEGLDLDLSIQWRRLDVIRTEAGGPFDAEGIVEFEARYRQEDAQGETQRGMQRETSRFCRESGRWYYLGEV